MIENATSGLLAIHCDGRSITDTLKSEGFTLLGQTEMMFGDTRVSPHRNSNISSATQRR
jgi:hypothetical protein